jgi:HIV Tat-specific factor 1
MHGRWFSGRKIEASFYTGNEHFKRSGGGVTTEADEAANEKARLEGFEKWLMAEGE